MMYGDIFRCFHQFTKLRLREVVPDISKSDYMTLCAIRNGKRSGDRITISELAKQLHVMAPAVSRTLRGLEERNLVERVVCRSDRRNTYVVLTKNGEEILKKAQGQINDFAESVMEKMGKEDMERLMDYLDRLYQACEQEIEQRKQKKEEQNEQDF